MMGLPSHPTLPSNHVIPSDKNTTGYKTHNNCRTKCGGSEDVPNVCGYGPMGHICKMYHYSNMGLYHQYVISADFKKYTCTIHIDRDNRLQNH